MDFNELASAFKGYFAATHSGDDFLSGDGWIYAVVKAAKDSAIHYELIRRGADYFIELHVETKHIRQEHRNGLLEAFRKKARYFTHFTYYSSNYWQTRMPVKELHEVDEDLDRITAVVDPVFEAGFSHAMTGVAPRPAVVDDWSSMTLEEVATKLRSDELTIPGVQRGRVWNAERMATLWDSILQDFPIGAFSVRRLADGRRELLDGQQRANAIALGYRSFPPVPDLVDRREAEERDPKAADVLAMRIALETPLLWIDLNGAEAISGTEKKFAFFVTTASQPWGYDFSSDETKNALLPTRERREATKGLDVSNRESGKPYPCELYPIRAAVPVPFSLFREFVEDLPAGAEACVGDFASWASARCADDGAGPNWRWLRRIQNAPQAVLKIAIANDLIKKVKGPFQRVFCSDATNVEDRDIALYFTRIGKGGVRPSDAELAFSVLKSKLDNGTEPTGFRSKVESIASGGMASASRIAEMAVRCFASGPNGFWGGNVLEKAIEISADDDTRKSFADFVNGRGKFKDRGFAELVKYVREDVFGITSDNKDDEGKTGFSEWHLSRYCSSSVGVFLFALLEVRDFEHTDELKHVLRATVELICNYGYLVDRCCRYIREAQLEASGGYKERVQLGLSRAFRDTYRGYRMLRVPMEPSSFTLSDFDGLVKAATADDALPNPVFREFNYGNPRAYSVLLYSCRGALPSYVPYSAQWAEENCPWDYDHMLPHVWVERMGVYGETMLCRKLINSIGNLSPLPYWLNRMISDGDRTRSYPFPEGYCEQGKPTVRTLQESLRIEPEKVGTYREKEFIGPEGAEVRKAFCMTTLARLSRLYGDWYLGTGMKELLDYENLDSDTPIDRRKRIMERLLAASDEMKTPYELWYLGDGSVEHRASRRGVDFYRYSWLSVGRVLGDFMISFTMNASGDSLELGLRKAPARESTTKAGFDELQSILERHPKPDGWSLYSFEKGDGGRYWYLLKTLTLGTVEETSGEVIAGVRTLETLFLDSPLNKEPAR